MQANQPIEDRSIQGGLVHGRGLLFGVIDGHGGMACAQAIADQLLNYTALALADFNTLEDIKEGKINPLLGLIHHHSQTCHVYNACMEDVYKKNLMNFCTQMLAHISDGKKATVQKALTHAFLSLDHAVITGPLSHSLDVGSTVYWNSLDTALAGAVCCVAYINGTDLFVANAGDSQAVLGVYKNGRWEAVPLSYIHDSNNGKEVERITKMHPNESPNIIRNGRLFGELMPLRAFGNARFKWKNEDIEELMRNEKLSGNLKDTNGETLVPKKYTTPPYLDAEPEVVHRILTPKDKFLVLASDGLWDCLSHEEVVKLVAGHMDGQQVLVHYTPTKGATLKEINHILTQRKDSMRNRALDTNAATHLLRSALGPDHGQVSAQLTLPDHLVRHYRDDITITVIYFNSKFIKDKKMQLHVRWMWTVCFLATSALRKTVVLRLLGSFCF